MSQFNQKVTIFLDTFDLGKLIEFTRTFADIDVKVEFVPPLDDKPECTCADYDGKGKSTCGFDCPVHKPKKIEKLPSNWNIYPNDLFANKINEIIKAVNSLKGEK